MASAIARGVPVGEDQRVLIVDRILVDTAERRQKRHRPAGHGLKARTPERLVGRGVDEHVAAAHQIGDLPAAEKTGVGDAGDGVTLHLREGTLVTAERDQLCRVAEGVADRCEGGKRGQRPPSRCARPDHRGDAQDTCMLHAPTVVEQLPIEARGHLRHGDAVQLADDVAQPMRSSRTGSGSGIAR